MPSLSLEDRLIWFAHCPKAGGTTIETLLVDTWKDRVGHLRWGWDLWWKQGGWRVATPPSSPQHLIWTDASEVLSISPDIVFALVRDPVRRLMSEHRYQRKYRRGRRAGRALACLPFSFWLRLMLAVARRNPYAFDNHLRPQTDFIPSHARVFRLEEGIEPVVNWLGDVTGKSGLSVPAPMLKTGSSAVPAPDTVALIEEAFAEDYARFGYDRLSDPLPDRGLLDRLAEALAPGVAALERRGLL